MSSNVLLRCDHHISMKSSKIHSIFIHSLIHPFLYPYQLDPVTIPSHCPALSPTHSIHPLTHLPIQSDLLSITFSIKSTYQSCSS